MLGSTLDTTSVPRTYMVKAIVESDAVTGNEGACLHPPELIWAAITFLTSAAHMLLRGWVHDVHRCAWTYMEG